MKVRISLWKQQCSSIPNTTSESFESGGRKDKFGLGLNTFDMGKLVPHHHFGIGKHHPLICMQCLTVYVLYFAETGKSWFYEIFVVFFFTDRCVGLIPSLVPSLIPSFYRLQYEKRGTPGL